MAIQLKGNATSTYSDSATFGGDITFTPPTGVGGIGSRILWTTESPFLDEVASIDSSRSSDSNAATDLVFNTGGGTTGAISETLRLAAGGSASFSGPVICLGDPSSGATNGTRLGSTVQCGASTSAGTVWAGYVVGTTEPTSTIKADGSITGGKIRAERANNTDICFEAYKIGDSQTSFRVRANGDIFSFNTTIQPLSSERRLKENIVSIDSSAAWETIKNTPYYAYNFIGSSSTVFGPMVDEVPAEMVVQPMEENEVGVMVPRSDEQGPIRTYDNGMLQARLYTALQTALTRIEALEAQLTQLTGGAN